MVEESIAPRGGHVEEKALDAFGTHEQRPQVADHSSFRREHRMVCGEPLQHSILDDCRRQRHRPGEDAVQHLTRRSARDAQSRSMAPIEDRQASCCGLVLTSGVTEMTHETKPMILLDDSSITLE